MSRTFAAPRFIALGALLAALAIGLGAFGAHALKARLGAQQMGWFQTAAQYHLIHAVALVAVAAAGGALHSPRLLSGCAWLLVAGTLLFSGSLYLMAVGAPRWLGAITPLGGLGLICAWFLLAAAAVSSRR